MYFLPSSSLSSYFYPSVAFPLQLTFIFMRTKSLSPMLPIFIISLYFLVLVLLTRQKEDAGLGVVEDGISATRRQW